MSKINCLVFLAACATAPSGPDEGGIAQPSRAEDLAYRAAAELAKRGIFAYFNGASLDGLTLHLDRGTLMTRFGAVDATDIDVTVSAAPGPLWGTFVPALSLRARTARVIAKPAAGGDSVKNASADVQWWQRAARLFAPAVQVNVDALHIRGIAGAVQARATVYPFSGKREIVAGLTNADIDVIARLRDEGDAITGRVAAKRVALPALTRGLRAFGRAKRPMLSGGSAYGVAEFAYERGERKSLAVKAAGHVQNACLEQRRFGEGKACGIDIGGAARIGAVREQVFVESSVVRIGGVAMRAEGHLPLTAGEEYDFTLHVPSQPVQRMLEAIPKTWRTGLHGWELEGTARADLSIRGVGDEVEIDPSFSFHNVKVVKAPPGQDPRRLNGPSTWLVPFPYQHTVSFAAEAGFTPLSSVPQLLVDAVRMSEDASFYGHDGFDRGQIAKALAELKGGQGARGASTITQQLAKNLYFDGDRNLTRKVEEAIATAALEASLSKHRLMEVYLNLIEWGDGIFGITRAARHYFDKAPFELSEREMAFLAGIIPAPRRADREMKNGGSAWAEKRTQRVLGFLCDVGKLQGDQCGFQSAAADADETAVLTNTLE